MKTANFPPSDALASRMRAPGTRQRDTSVALLKGVALNPSPGTGIDFDSSGVSPDSGQESAGILGCVRGFYATSDPNYGYIGVRGFNQPADFGSVVDNGVGIPPENLARIFQHGFTTRKDRHGFALHSGALAAQEMGGSLTPHSDGRGQGATFTLELPTDTTTTPDGANPLP